MIKIKKRLFKEIDGIKQLLKNVSPLMLTFFVLSVVTMNILANKSIDLSWVPGNNGAFPWLALDGGLLVSWIAFFSMNIIERKCGPKSATQLTIVAVGINLIICAIFLAAGSLSGIWGESFGADGSVNMLINTALDRTISGTWFILLGSTIAFITASVVHGLVNWTLNKFLKEDTLKNYRIKSYAATGLAQFTDNMLFAIIVSHTFFGWNWLQCITCSLTGMLFECIFELVLAPIGYKISKKLYGDV